MELADVAPRGPKLDPAPARLRSTYPSRATLGAGIAARVRSLAHVDDTDRATTYRSVLADHAPGYADLSPAEQGLVRMLLFSLWPNGAFASYQDGLEALRSEPALRDEVRSVVDMAFDNARHLTAPAEDRRLTGLKLAGPRPLPTRRDPRRPGACDAQQGAIYLPRGRPSVDRMGLRRIPHHPEKIGH